MGKLYHVTVYIEVDDENALYEAAVTNYAGANMHTATVPADSASRKEADLFLKPEGEIDIGACLVQVIDPGQSPPGISILESEATSDQEL